MAVVRNNRNRTISSRHSRDLKAVKKRKISDKPVSSSSNTTTSSLRREFRSSCRGFLRFKLWVRASVLFKKFQKKKGKKARHRDDSQAQAIEDDDRIEEHSSTNWDVRNGKNGNNLRVSIEKKKLVEFTPEPFLPLKEEEKAEVKSAFSGGNRMKILVSHKNSNIEISGETLRCLMPTQWLNDEVSNLYLALLKERETRDPQKYLKCHFFNTFFYVKLVSDSGYNYKAVRRWTTHTKLGYDLIDCDMIFVPIHIGIHWTLAVINNKERKFMYLDSLNGVDHTVLDALAKYFVDEVKDKSGKNIDVSSWDMEFVKELPQQQNGFDCGLFMLKYIDFYSRGLSLQFSQKDMPYFRLRTAKEILRLRAD